MKIKNSIMHALTGAASLMLASTFAAHASPPPEGSPQYKLMHPYADFITKMYARNPVANTKSWCCDWADGRGDLQERRVTGADGKSHFQVKATREAYGKSYNDLIPPEGLWIDVPDEKVLKKDDADENCKAIRADNPNNTCDPPMFNILWLAASKGEGGKPYVYCYWPVQKLGALEQKSNVKFASSGQTPQPAFN